MQHADILLTGGTVLTSTGGWIARAGGGGCQGDSIVAVGPEEVVRAQVSTDTVVDCGGRSCCRAGQCTHAHAHVAAAAMADDLRLDVWLMGYMMPAEREFVSPSSCGWARSYRARR